MKRIQLVRRLAALALCGAIAILNARNAAAQSPAQIDASRAQALDALAPSAQLAPDQVLNGQVTLALQNRGALTQLLADQQNPASPQYHRWVSPAQFASRFRPSAAAAGAVANWLSSRGLSVGEINTKAGYIRFTGHAADLESAFNTTIAATADGKSFGNISDLQIPASLAGQVSGVIGLDNLRHAVPAGLRLRPPAARPPDAPAELWPSLAPASLILPQVSEPQFNGPVGTFFGPADLASFYDETPVLAAGQTGGGQCIALLEDSDFLDAAVSQFNSTFALPALQVTRVFADKTSPGIGPDESEALLDIEWAHAVAPAAPISTYIGNASATTADPIIDALSQAVSDNLCAVISVSFAFCGTSGSFFTGTADPILMQAAAQGQSVLISSGDQGAAALVINSTNSGCVPGTVRGVNELAADPNVTAVGGSQFTPSYDTSGNNAGSQPEAVWDQQTGVGAGASGGGASAVFAKPSYQSTGTPADKARDLPDVALGASPVMPGFYASLDNNGVPELTCCVGGTSLSTVVWAGLSKVLAQASGARLGNLNPKLYQLGNSPSAAQNGLRDITSGINTFNGVAGFAAGPGYDQSSGWGTPDMQLLLNAFTANAVAAVTATPITAAANAGATVTAGSFQVANSGSQSVTINSIAISVSNPSLFSSLALTPESTAAASAPSSATVSFALASIQIPPGQSLSFNLSVTTAASTAAAAKLAPGQQNQRTWVPVRQGLVAMAGFLCLGLTLAGPRSRWRGWLIVIVAAAALATVQTGCGGGSGQAGSTSSIQSIAAGGLVAPSAEVSGLPVTLSTISLN